MGACDVAVGVAPLGTAQAGYLSCPDPWPHALLRWAVEPADYTGLRQVEACALHKARLMSG